MHRSKLAVCAAVILCSACDIEPKVLQPEYAVVPAATVPFVDTFTNPCTGGTVTVSGTIELTTRTNVDAAGGVHTRTQARVSDVSAVDESGNTFRATGGFMNAVFFGTTPGVAISSARETLNLRSNEPGSGIVVQSVAHVTFANGEAKAIVVHENVQCTGN